MTETSAYGGDVDAKVAYLADARERVTHLIYPPSSGRATVRPEQEYREMTIRDCRGAAERFGVDAQGFELLEHRTAFNDFNDDEAIRRRYYPEVTELLKDAVGAEEVIVFDHNIRSALRAARGEHGVRAPVDAAHNDYTLESGPRRIGEILRDADRPPLEGRRAALVNAWRPLVGPVRDVPLTVCDARSTSPGDFVQTDIHHFGEGDLENPRHSGQIYSVRYNPSHRWHFVSDMQPDEVLLLKNFDTREDGAARFTPHTGFKNPKSPPDAVPRESIEARTLVIFAD